MNNQLAEWHGRRVRVRAKVGCWRGDVNKVWLVDVQDASTGEYMTRYTELHCPPRFHRQLREGAPIEVTVTVSLSSQKFGSQTREYRLIRPTGFTALSEENQELAEWQGRRLRIRAKFGWWCTSSKIALIDVQDATTGEYMTKWCTEVHCDPSFHRKLRSLAPIEVTVTVSLSPVKLSWQTLKYRLLRPTGFTVLSV